MEQVRSLKPRTWARKLAVESEPGLTNAQLMLTNHDLKPVEPERRQWGECVTLMLRSIWTKYEDVPNGLPTSSGTNTREFLGFFLFWLFSLPAIWFPVHKIRHLFTVKAYFVPTAGIAFFIWAIVRAHGIGPIVHQPAKAHGTDLAWGMVKGIMSSIANFATLIVNDPDFARFARKPRDALWSQLFTIPIGFAVTSFIGIIVSSSSQVIYGETIWNPLDLLTNFLQGASSGERFGVFIISFAFALAQLGTNIAANSVSAGTDMTALLPRYLNIRRGGYICAAVGLAMCPCIVGFVGAIGKPVPIGATYIYNLNFFCGFIVSFSVYWLLCWISPIPATSDRWMEVGDEIRNVSVAYGNEEGYDAESASGSDQYDKGMEAGDIDGPKHSKANENF
ncbi:hypothetical protein MMC25_008186 [Agyrium rufum]|nr:hypothetical protein [Agyrium rufum]